MWSCFGASKGKSILSRESCVEEGHVLWSQRLGHCPSDLFGRYEQEAHKRATVENDFVVLKKVRVGQKLHSDPEHSRCTEPSPGLGGQGVGDPNAGYAIMLPAAPPGKWDICLDIGTHDKI